MNDPEPLEGHKWLRDWIRGSDLRPTPEQLADALRVIETMGRGREPREILPLLTPIFARTAREQSRLLGAPTRTGQELSTKTTHTEPEVNAPKPDEDTHQPVTREWKAKRRLRWLLPFVALVLCAGALLWSRFSGPGPIDSPPIDPKTSKPVAAKAIVFTVRNVKRESLDSVPSIPQPFFQSPDRYLGFATIGTLLALSFSFLAKGGWRRWKRRRAGPPYEHRFWEGREGILYDQAALNSAARAMRRRRAGPQERLDIRRTLRDTIRSAGLAQFHYRPVPRVPEHLALLDRDGLPRIERERVEHLLGGLKDQDVHITIFDFDPVRGVALPRGEGPAIDLETLSGRFPEHRLLFFSDGLGFLDEATDGLATWVRLLRRWENRFLLMPEKPSGRFVPHQDLDKALSVLPANLAALAALNDGSRAEMVPSTIPNFPPYGVTPSEEVKHWRRILGEPTFQWLCALAVYPETHFGLTLRIGAKVPRLASEAFREEGLLALARVEALQEKFMPAAFREALLAAIDPEVESDTRSALIAMMDANPPKPGSHAENWLSYERAAQAWELQPDDPSTWPSLRRHMRQAERSRLDRDRLLVKRVSPPDNIRMPAGLRRAIYHGGISALGLSTGSKALIPAFVALGAASVMSQVRVAQPNRLVRSETITDQRLEPERLVLPRKATNVRLRFRTEGGGKTSISDPNYEFDEGGKISTSGAAITNLAVGRGQELGDLTFDFKPSDAELRPRLSLKIGDKAFTIPVSWQKPPPDFRLEPREVLKIPGTPPGETRSGLLHVIAGSGFAPTPFKAEASPPFTVAPASKSANDAAAFVVRLPGNGTPRIYRGTVMVSAGKLSHSVAVEGEVLGSVPPDVSIVRSASIETEAADEIEKDLLRAGLKVGGGLPRSSWKGEAPRLLLVLTYGSEGRQPVEVTGNADLAATVSKAMAGGPLPPTSGLFDGSSVREFVRSKVHPIGVRLGDVATGPQQVETAEQRRWLGRVIAHWIIERLGGSPNVEPGEYPADRTMARLSRVKGPVTVEGPYTSVRGVVGLRLFAGTTVSLDDGGACSLQMPDSSMIHLVDGARLEIGSSGDSFTLSGGGGSTNDLTSRTNLVLRVASSSFPVRVRSQAASFMFAINGSSVTLHCAAGQIEVDGRILSQGDDTEVRAAPLERLYTPLEKEKLFGPLKGYPVGQDGTIQVPQDWIDKNIEILDLPSSAGKRNFRVSVNRAVAPSLRDAFADLEELGLLADVESVDGGFVPRRIRGTANPSAHSYGLALDLNSRTNPVGSKGAAKGAPGSLARIIPVMARHGFLWGGNFAYPDPAHFEYVKSG